MKNFDELANIILKEAPISSYLKTAVNPASYVRGAGKVMQGAGQAAGLFQTSSDYLSRGLSKAGTAAAGLRFPGLGSEKEKTSSKTSSKSQTTQQPTGQDQSIDFAKTKTNFIINNRQLLAKYAGTTKHGFPIYRIQGVPWAKSVIVELKGKNKAVTHFYTDKKPNIKKPPTVQRSSILDFSPVQNNLIVRTK